MNLVCPKHILEFGLYLLDAFLNKY